MGKRITSWVLCLGVMPMLMGRAAIAETCTTQSQMKDADRQSLVSAALDISGRVQANDIPGLRSRTVAEYARDFSPVEFLVGNTSPKLKGGAAAVDQVYLLDAAQIKSGTGSGAADAQFFCSLNRSMSEVDFLIPGLTPGTYGFAIVNFTGGTGPLRLSMLLRQESGRWMMAGLYPRSTQAAGHEGLWYWKEARRMGTEKERWNAWLYYQQAEALLKPVNFLQSTHLEKLRDEQNAVAPPAVSQGVSADVPLIVKGANGAEYAFTGLTVDDSLAKDKVDVAAHLKVEQIGDPVAARKRNEDAMRALVAAYPEFRKAFHGVWVFAEVAGQNPFGTELAMSEIK